MKFYLQTEFQSYIAVNIDSNTEGKTATYQLWEQKVRKRI